MTHEGLKVGELAKRTGLTIRTLHHYDTIGLLTPSWHTESGHRLYTPDDVARLQQVRSLRQLGFTLAEIRACLDKPDLSPLEVIRLHVARLREQIGLQEQLCSHLEAVARHFCAAEKVSVEELLQTIEEMSMIEKLSDEEMKKQFAEVGKIVGPEEIRAIEQAWTALMAEVRSQTHLDPASAEAQELGGRWEALTERTMRGYRNFPRLKEAIADNYQQGKFEGHAHAPQAADFAFIERIKAARKG